MKVLAAVNVDSVRKSAELLGLYVITQKQYRLLQWAEHQIEIQRLQEESKELLDEVLHQ